jgi:hypothetical protein
VTNAADSGAGSLRQAILDANATGGADVIAFDIPGSGVQTIAPASPLPAVTDPLTIDGTTQPGYAGAPLIELDGLGAGQGVTGLDISAPVCVGVFDDVPCPSPFADWIEQLSAEGITGGCRADPALYCPSNATTRGQAAAFLSATFGLE